MCKTTAVLTISIAVLVAVVLGAQFVNPVWANPYSHIFPAYSGEADPPSDTQPPRITILSPERNSTLNTNNLHVSFKVEVGQSQSAESKMIQDVYYKADWLENKTYVYEYSPSSLNHPEKKTDFSTTLNLTGIPEGRHTVIICATENGTYYDPPFSEWPMWSLEFNVKTYSFQIVGASAVSFTIDVTPLNVTVLPITNQILVESGKSDVPLNFTVNGLASKISCALDGQDNVTIAGNTTLAGISIGAHNIVVYVWDEAGNVGCSEIISFTVAAPEHFPVVPVAILAIVAASAVIGLLYHERRKRQMRMDEYHPKILDPSRNTNERVKSGCL